MLRGGVNYRRHAVSQQRYLLQAKRQSCACGQCPNELCGARRRPSDAPQCLLSGIMIAESFSFLIPAIAMTGYVLDETGLTCCIRNYGVFVFCHVIKQSEETSSSKYFHCFRIINLIFSLTKFTLHASSLTFMFPQSI